MDGKSDFVAPALYMTGATWPDKVNKFRMVREADNFDYNSSDIVVEIDKETFYGISLKKKKNGISYVFLKGPRAFRPGFRRHDQKSGFKIFLTIYIYICHIYYMYYIYYI